ncbi:DNA polymerase II large subunit [Legionella massiliensis]|uniref:DNA polymerase II large subunit n=1 Tax=Legionella massiliensis TaxID=1034943 RepID=A0A078KYD9_9GAMM|nr:polymorphic toxin-type HINT domain-containing protein [Legionella massiliensis]CDZ77931.1 DNA polymerase II large subunit [Legionella massiliensis]CEE13669.1 Hint module [Legionella massiliensis]
MGRLFRYFLVFSIATACSLNLWARGGGGCFEQGTLVSTPRGPIPIEQLKDGDWVWGSSQGKYKQAQIVSTTQIKPESYLEFQLPAETLHVTDEHLFALAMGIFKRAASLQPGDKLIIWQKGQWQELPILTIKRIKAHKPAFNLLVDHGATYFANGILVHNKGCFLPNTPILQANGTTIPISQIRPGDLVRAYEIDGRIVTTEVRGVIKHQATDYYVLSTDKITLNVTAEHPFFVGNGRFKTLEALKPGELIYVLVGDSLQAQRIREIHQVSKATTVYNLQTDVPHTYFAAGIAVHNKGGGCFPAGTQIQTATGPKAIELLSPGEQVRAINRNGLEVSTKIESIYTTQSPILTVETDLGTLHTTKEHPLAQGANYFTEAGRLVVHDQILFKTAKGFKPATILSLHTEAESLVFNLRVQTPHTFIADGFLVHNKGGGGYGGGGGSEEGLGGLLFAIFLVFALGWFTQHGAEYKRFENLDYNFSRNVIRRKASKTDELLKFLARQDKTVAPETLIKRVRIIFRELQKCWQAREYTPMETLLMPDLYMQHCLQISAMTRNHEINILDSLIINNIDLVNLRYTEKKEQREFTALITATVRDYYVDDRNHEFLRGDQSAETFQEFWTFQYDQDLGWLLREIEQTRESDYLKEENFVEQFTELQIEKIYQDKVDNLGVAGPGLKQDVEIKANKVERMLNFLVQADKLWDKRGMENRVSKVFSSVHLALEAGALDAQVDEQLFPEVAAQFRETVDGWRALGKTIEYRNFCIRKIEIVLVKNFNDKTKDEFTARVTAHAQRILKQDSFLLSQDSYVTPFTEYWVFGRLDGVWKLKEVLLGLHGDKTVGIENVEEGSSLDLIKWYYTKKRAL